MNIPVIKMAFKSLSFEERVSLCDEQGVHFAYLEAVLTQPGDQQSTFTADVFKQLVARAATRWPHLAFGTPAPLTDAELAELARLILLLPLTYHTSPDGEFAAPMVNGRALLALLNGEPVMRIADAERLAAANALPSLLARLAAAEARTAPAGIWSNGDFMNVLVGLAKAYRSSAQASIARNSHMHDLPLGEEAVPDQAQIDAVLTNFLNHVGVSRGMDLGLYSSDLATVKGGQQGV